MASGCTAPVASRQSAPIIGQQVQTQASFLAYMDAPVQLRSGVVSHHAQQYVNSPDVLGSLQEHAEQVSHIGD
jgi:hypothetical protein